MPDRLLIQMVRDLWEALHHCFITLEAEMRAFDKFVQVTACRLVNSTFLSIFLDFQSRLIIYQTHDSDHGRRELGDNLLVFAVMFLDQRLYKS